MPRNEDKVYLMDFARVASRAKETEAAAREAKRDLHRCMLFAARAMVAPGKVVDLRLKNKLPEYFRNLRVVSGNARNSRVFKIFRLRGIDVEPGRLFNSTWTCNAVAVSEKTGKPMNGNLVLRGNFVQVDDFRDEVLVEAESRLLASIAGELAKSSVSAAVSREKAKLRQVDGVCLPLKIGQK